MTLRRGDGGCVLESFAARVPLPDNDRARLLPASASECRARKHQVAPKRATDPQPGGVWIRLADPATIPTFAGGTSRASLHLH